MAQDLRTKSPPCPVLAQCLPQAAQEPCGTQTTASHQCSFILPKITTIKSSLFTKIDFPTPSCLTPPTSAISTSHNLESIFQSTVLFGGIFDNPPPACHANLWQSCWGSVFLLGTSPETAVPGPAAWPQKRHLLPQKSGSCWAMERVMILEAWLSR